MKNLHKYAEKTAVIKERNELRTELIEAFAAGALIRWRTELVNRIIPENLELVKAFSCLHNEKTCSDRDVYMWNQVQSLRLALAKDTMDSKSLFTRIKNAIADGDFDVASDLQVEMAAAVSKLKNIYDEYRCNIIDE